MAKPTPADALKFTPAQFADVVVVALAAGQGAQDGEGFEGVAKGSGEVALTVPDSPYQRAAFALKAKFPHEPQRFRSALWRFSAMMDLLNRNALDVWVRRTENHERSMLHPAVLDVAATMRVNKNGRFAPRKFIEQVALIAAENYGDDASWQAVT